MLPLNHHLLFILFLLTICCKKYHARDECRLQASSPFGDIIKSRHVKGLLSLVRSHTACFTRPNRRACSQAKSNDNTTFLRFQGCSLVASLLEGEMLSKVCKTVESLSQCYRRQEPCNSWIMKWILKA